jgi:hypothetical protein
VQNWKGKIAYMRDTVKQSMLHANRNMEEKLSHVKQDSKKSELILDFKEFWHEKLGEIKLLEAHENSVEWEFIFLCTIILPSIMFSLLDSWVFFLAAILIHTLKHVQYRTSFPLLRSIKVERERHNQLGKSGTTSGEGEQLNSEDHGFLIDEVKHWISKIKKFAKKSWLNLDKSTSKAQKDVHLDLK